MTGIPRKGSALTLASLGKAGSLAALPPFREGTPTKRPGATARAVRPLAVLPAAEKAGAGRPAVVTVDGGASQKNRLVSLFPCARLFSNAFFFLFSHYHTPLCLCS